MGRFCRTMKTMAEQRVPDPLEYELQEARAMALGHAGKKVEAALAALAAGPSDELVDAAANAVWELLITRESLRFYDHKQALAFFGVPPAVMARVGVYKPRH